MAIITEIVDNIKSFDECFDLFRADVAIDCKNSSLSSFSVSSIVIKI